jgi:hypothetical protein
LDRNHASRPDQIDLKRDAARYRARRSRPPCPFLKFHNPGFMQLFESPRQIGFLAVRELRERADRIGPERSDQVQECKMSANSAARGNAGPGNDTEDDHSRLICSNRFCSPSIGCKSLTVSTD